MAGDSLNHAVVDVAVVGFGYWGPNHARVLSRLPGVRLTVVDPSPEQQDRARAAHPDAIVRPSLAACDHHLDGVVICSPPNTHLAVTGEAFARGCHALVEKPLALSAVEAEAMVAMAAEAGRTLMTGHIYDFHAATVWLEQQARAAAFGTVRYLDAARLAVGGYRTDANVMWDMAPHDLCLMHRVMGRWPTRVTAWAIDHSGLGIADVAHLRLEFPGDEAVGYIRVSWLDPVKVRRFTVVGDEQMVVFNDAANPNEPIRVIRTGDTSALGAGATHPVPGAYPDELIDVPVIEPVEPLEAELRQFLHCIRAGEQPAWASGADGLQVVRILEAADLSAAAGEPVVVGAPAATGSPLATGAAQ